MQQKLGYGVEPRAEYAVNPNFSKGRFFPEDDSPTRTVFQRDRDRVIHSTAFRRLKYKTQVFVYHEGDHFRTRLTHSIEVAQIARSIARALRLDEDLTEALALAHDLGHAPFGHEGESTLNDCLRDNGGFDHNAQSFRVVTSLERRYATFDGLNLTWETLEGLVKHNGPLTDAKGNAIGKFKNHSLPIGITSFPFHTDLMLETWPGAEAQAAAIADDIAYNAHDIDDGLRAQLFCIEDMKNLTLVSEIIQEVDNKYPKLEKSRRINEIHRRVITRSVEDVIKESMKRIDNLTPKNPDDIRKSDSATIIFSPSMTKSIAEIKTFLRQHMYKHENILSVRKTVSQVVRELFEEFVTDPTKLPADWYLQLQNKNKLDRSRGIADYIAGMTDRFALKEHNRVLNVQLDLLY